MPSCSSLRVTRPANSARTTLGDRDEFLPTVHGFDEFFGNLYHLNAEEEPELPDYPKDPAFKKQFGPRGVLHCKADGKGGQTIVDTGPLTKKRMETIDEEITDKALAWMETQAKADKPFFLWYNATAIALPYARRRKESRQERPRPVQRSDGRSRRADRHDARQARRARQSPTTPSSCTPPTTDPKTIRGPTARPRPSRGQKDSNWEGGWRVPCFMRWPGKIKPDSVLNGIVSPHRHVSDAAGRRRQSGCHQALLDGSTVDGKKFNVHLDGFNMVPYLTGQAKESPRPGIIYFSDDGDVIAVRGRRLKFNLAVQRANTMRQWAEPFVKLRCPTS